MENSEPRYFGTRAEWRQWLRKNHDKEKGIWFIFPLKSSGEEGIPYNDAVEEALCFGWIDSTVRPLDENRRAQRFSPRNPKSTYSQANKERLRWLVSEGLIHESMKEKVAKILAEEFIFPPDIIEVLRDDEIVWKNYQQFSDVYKRVRIAYIDDARERPEEFDRRLNNFIDKTRKGMVIAGYGGVAKHY